jgi:hypothetical protein
MFVQIGQTGPYNPFAGPFFPTEGPSPGKYSRLTPGGEKPTFYYYPTPTPSNTRYLRPASKTTEGQGQRVYDADSCQAIGRCKTALGAINEADSHERIKPGKLHGHSGDIIHQLLVPSFEGNTLVRDLESALIIVGLSGHRFFFGLASHHSV